LPVFFAGKMPAAHLRSFVAFAVLHVFALKFRVPELLFDPELPAARRRSQGSFGLANTLDGSLSKR
jgi:hypothetical protein